jgi:hypothetical protein
VFQTGSPGLDGRPVAADAGQLAIAVRRLVVDPDLRRQEGAATRAEVGAAHDGPGWLAALEVLYEQARAATAVDVDTLGDSHADPAYGALLLSAWAPATVSPDPYPHAGPLRELYDDRLRGDLIAVSRRTAGASLTVRVAPGWERQGTWTSRLLRLAGAHDRLTVSMPFAADDDVHGTRSTERIVALLDGIGRSPEDCGDVRVESDGATAADRSFDGDLPFTAESLDWLEAVLGSTCWEAVPV